MAKERIIRQLGEDTLLLPELVAEALGANDRVKYLLTLLQTARSSADGAQPTDLREERIAAGVQDPTLDRVVAQSARSGEHAYTLPQAERIVSTALRETETMIAPLLTANVAAAKDLSGRLAAIEGSLTLEGDEISAAALSILTSAGRERDSLHLLVLDAHRELNALAATLAGETIDGARVHSLQPGDAELVRAFMLGVHETERLRFGHPGLGTIATRNGAMLVLQNDLGLTDAHVVVVKVQDGVVTITYTDVHMERLVFFQRMLARRGVEWEDTRSRTDERLEGGLFHLASGRYEGSDQDAVRAFLTELGSRLVFIIDWNRARKRLRGLVGKRAAVELLSWSAEHDHGHRAFLIAGGEGLIQDALQLAGRAGGAGGPSLSTTLGPGAAVDYLRAVLRICSEGMLDGRSLPLIQDEVRAELVGYLHTARQELLGLVSRHGELVVEIAEAAREELARALQRGGGPVGAAARQARAWEHEADEVVTRLRAYVTRTDGPAEALAVIEAADDIADSLEDAAFHLTLVAGSGPCEQIAVPLRKMCDLLIAAARGHLRTVMLAADIQRGASREDLQAFLEAVHSVVSLERQTDDAQRSVHCALAVCAPSAGELFVLAEVTSAFEQAADATMHAALLLRDQVLDRAMRTEILPRRQEPGEGPSRSGVSASEEIYLISDTSGPLPGPEVIGAKAHGLARMARAGLRVPAAVVLSTAVSRRAGSERSPEVAALVAQALASLQATTGLELGDRRRPLVLSVRSGAPVSMPGMLETVVDVGLSSATVDGFAGFTGNPRLAWDSYRRLIESFATVVRSAPAEPFERAVEAKLAAGGVERPLDLEVMELKDLATGHLQRFAEATGGRFPDDPQIQLEQAVVAVLRSWGSEKAKAYRQLANVPDDLGTAVIMQRMVFGNAGGRSGAGVGFTRDPALGARGLYLDFTPNAQGEDIVAGRQLLRAVEASEEIDPDLFAELERTCELLERELGDAQEFEFTVQDGELFLLQSRTAKRTPWAALQIAVDQVSEGLISPQTALSRLAGIDLDGLRLRRVRAEGAHEALAHAIPASVGVASGPIALDTSAAKRMAAAGTPPVIVRREISTDDITAMIDAAGILTAAGGRTSHAAVVARELGKPCLVGCAELTIDLDGRTMTAAGRQLAEGDLVTLDGESGLLFEGRAEVVEERPTAALAAVERWRARSHATPIAS